MSRRAVVIVGFMGAGKTTVGRALALLLGETFADLDDAVRELEGRGPRELIDEEGEDYFRGAETRALRRVLERGVSRARLRPLCVGGRGRRARRARPKDSRAL